MLESFLLSCNGAARPLAAACIGFGALTARGQPTAMPQASVAADIHQPPDAHIHLSPQASFNLVAILYDTAQLIYLTLGQGVDPGIEIHPGLLENLGRQAPANSIDIGEANSNSLIAG